MTRALAAAPLLALATCAGPTPAGSAAAPAQAVTLVRLLDAIGDHAVTLPPAAATAAALPLLSESFDGLPPEIVGDARRLPSDWVSGAGLLGRASGGGPPLQSALWCAREESGATVAFVQRESAGMLRDLALPEESAARVRVRMRSLGADAEPGGLFLTALEGFTEPLPPPDRPNRKQRVAVSARALAPFQRQLDAARQQEWQELELYVPPLARREGLRIAIQAGPSGVLVDRVEVFPVAKWERTLEEPRAPDDRSRVPWRRIVRCGGERADALLLPVGARVAVEVTVPSLAPRFEAAVSLLAAPGAAPCELLLRVDGRDVAQRSFASPATDAARPFETWSVPLDPLAGRRAALELSVRGDGSATVVVGAPLLLGTPPAPRGPSRPRNLLLISIDTLRADQLGCFGATPSVTPNLDGLAAAGTRFSRVEAASSWTLPSHATIFTGQPPPVHGAEQFDRRLDGAATPPLAARLAARGYVTAAFTGGGLLDPNFGFATGFDRYSTHDRGKLGRDEMPTHDAMGGVTEWISTHADQPFFLFFHTYLVHDYEPNDEYLARFPPPPGVTIPPRLRQGIFSPETKAGAADLPALRALYAAALAQADERVIGRLLRELHAQGLDDSTVVALVSDHGEQWFEHGRLFHGEEVWSELVHVPWIVRGPGIEAGVVIDERVGHLDVAPTLLALLGAGAADGAPELPGRDVFSAPQRADLAQRPLLLSYQSIGPRRVDALLLGPWKLVRRRADPTAEPEHLLFRVDRDPGELDDLAAREPERVRELARRLDHELSLCETAARALHSQAPDRIELDPELARQLRELGYLQD